MYDWTDFLWPEVKRRGIGEVVLENVEEKYSARGNSKIIPRWSEHARKFKPRVETFVMLLP